MEDKMKEFLSNNDLDIFEPHFGHEDRFLRKLEQSKAKGISFKWLSVAASVVLLIGFYFGAQFKANDRINIEDINPEMGETQMFFVNAINQELREIEKYRTLDTETIIEDALDDIEELEEHYQNYVKDLRFKGNEQQVIQAMVTNYQQRLKVLQNLQSLIERLKKPTNQNIEFNETI
ncbi:hypothetical protein BTO06_07905 [Tenacibaculum sp. SZ-18]|uniref:hypothetical protein n=1 Tax=Tenacibaculum sp. SZ-18 TaxID=754423 RepID=UPI000C2D08CF|nr:hypothetical protein [Tenacibaculum sp. SZ-18]AUC15062.1 hypothetical protein BTO06_07905 [Tenacibaculum sp. SZ-18]